MDEKGSPELALPIFELALEKDSKSLTIQIFNALANAQTSINLPFITADSAGPKHLDMSLTRAKFNELTADLVEKTVGPTKQAIKDSGLSANEILLIRQADLFFK